MSWQPYAGPMTPEVEKKLGMGAPQWHHGAWLARTPDTRRAMWHPPIRQLARRAGVGLTIVQGLPQDAIAVAQNTDNSGDLNIRSGPGTGNPVVGGIPNSALFYIVGQPQDTNGNAWPDPNNDMPNASPDQNAWYPAATADFSVRGFVAAGPGTSGERLTTITGQTTPISPPGPSPQPGPGPQPQPQPQPGPTTTAAATSNTGTIVAALVVAGVLGAGAWWYSKHGRRHAHA